MIPIPHPDNPQHVDNLRSIPLLEQQGFEGSDVTLSIALFEYDLIWRKLDPPLEDGDDYLFIYHISGEDSASRYDRVLMSSGLDLKKEYNWVDWEDFLKTNGTPEHEWVEIPFAVRIYDLFRVYGYENMFGASHWEGFPITEEDEPSE